MNAFAQLQYVQKDLLDLLSQDPDRRWTKDMKKWGQLTLIVFFGGEQKSNTNHDMY